MAFDLTTEGYKKRLKTCMDARASALKEVDNMHVKLQQGNSKTGSSCWTVSLMPVIDCVNCKECKQTCYDLKADLRFPLVVKDRAKNSAIHKVDPSRYWSEIDVQIKANHVTQLRINVGGDLTDEDFANVAQLGKANKGTMILFFTKNYDGINKFLEHHRFPKNVHPIISRWEGLDVDNKHHIPESHVLYDDGRTTAPEYGAYYCTGNCSECAIESKGCWSLKKNEHVVFLVH